MGWNESDVVLPLSKLGLSLITLVTWPTEWLCFGMTKIGFS